MPLYEGFIAFLSPAIIDTMKEIYFMRHGESTANAKRIIAGHADAPLTKKGIEQAHMAGRDIVRQKLTFDLIFSSPLKRALDTAHIVAGEVGLSKDIIISDLLIEQSRGNLEGKSVDILETITDSELVAQGGEGAEALSLRARQTLEWCLQQEGDQILIVSHNRLGKAILGEAKPFDSQDNKKLPNAQVLKILSSK